MEEIYHTISTAVDLWRLPKHSENDIIVATEFWLQHATNKVSVETRKIGPESRDAWLNKRTKGTGDEAQSLLTRFVWLVADDNSKKISLSSPVRDILLERFGLGLADKYFKTFYSGVTGLPRVSTPELDQRAYAFCYAPKIAAIWSHTVSKESPNVETITEGLIFTRSALRKDPLDTSAPGEEEGPLRDLQRFLEVVPWNANACRSPTFPPYLFSLMLSRQMNDTQAGITKSIQQIESRTGYHEFANRNEIGASNGLAELSARASGHAAKLASVKRKGQVVEKLLDFITETVDEEAAYQDRDLHLGGDMLKDNARVLQKRLEMQRIEVEYTLKRVEIQIQALFHLISQYDSINNYELSLWTKDISLTSQRDAASMKTLAVVTMFFLPGSFISALFSTPLFDWDTVDLTQRDSIGVPLTPQFRLYWAVTVPLTLVTFILYSLWLLSLAKQRQTIAKQREERIGQEISRAYEAHDINGQKEAERQRIARTRRRRTLPGEGTIGEPDVRKVWFDA